MEFGMLWYDNNPTSDLPQKVERAAAYYHKKYGAAPNLCLVNPQMLKEDQTASCSLDIKTTPIILHHHLWIGVAVNQDKPKM